MKKSTFGWLPIMVIVSIELYSCKSSSENPDDVSVNINEATKVVRKEMPIDSLSDYAKLKVVTSKLIADNELKIADFKSRLKSESTVNQAKFQAQIDTLLSKNKLLKTDLNTYKEQGLSKWNAFKSRVQKSVDDVNQDIETYKNDHKY